MLRATICPTVLAANPHVYREQMEKVEPFAKRIHVDVADGIFAHTKTIGLDQVWWRGDRTIDLHLMYKNPLAHAKVLVALKPRLVIVHAEAEGDFVKFANLLHRYGIEVGVALLPSTEVEIIAPAINLIDHALVFSGDLGHFGGHANFDMLQKVEQLRRLKPVIEVGWDGGVDDRNARQLAKAGIDVLNVGGFIQRAHDPKKAYARLEVLV